MTEPLAGKYRLEARLGAGAMGEVWKALDTELDRWVALKFLKGGDDEEIARFEREAQIAGRLTHPNIAAIYEVGQAEHRHFLAMQFVDGRTLKTVPRHNVREMVRIARDAALALQYAHAQGVIHRDVKPDNIMVGVDGRVYVMDFGLARSVKAGSSMTASGMMVGTPAYMSPEQARGEVRTLDARTDVYGLGATLYELLTDRAPFRGETALDVALKVLEEEPPAPRRVNAGLDPDLETIVVKCMEKERGQRYATAGELAADLDRWLQGEPIRARPASVAYRLRKRMAKGKAVLIAAGLGVVAVAAVLLFLLPRFGAERRRLELWTRLTGIVNEADVSRRGGDIAGSQAKLDEGVALCRKALETDDTALGRFFLGRMLHARSDEAGALRELTRALEIDPSLGEARFERGLVRVEGYALRFSEFTASREEALAVVEERHPDLRRLREEAERDLAAEVAASTFVREADGFYGRGELARLRGDANAAARELRQALEKDPNHARARLALARVYYQRGEGDEAVTQLNEALSRDRGFAEGWAVRAVWQFHQGQIATGPKAREFYDDALEAVNYAITMGHRLPGAYNTRGSILLQYGRLDEAIADYTEALRLSPDYSSAYANRGGAHYAKGAIDDAIRDCTEAIRLDPTALEAWLNRSAARAAKGDRRGSIEDCDTILTKLKPDDAQTWCNRGLTYTELGEFDRAAGDLDMALKLNPRLPQALRGKAVLLQRKGEFKAAGLLIDELLKVDAKDSDAWRLRAALLINYAEQQEALGQPPTEIQRILRGAVSDATKAISFDAANAAAYYNRAVARVRLNEPEAALKDLDAGLKIAPGMPDARTSRAAVYLTMRDRVGRGTEEAQRLEEAALADLIEAVKADAGYVPALINLANLRLERREWDAAMAAAQTSIRIRETPEAQGVIGIANLNKGDKPAAARALKRALQIAPPGWNYRQTVERLLAEAEK